MAAAVSAARGVPDGSDARRRPGPSGTFLATAAASDVYVRIACSHHGRRRKVAGERDAMTQRLHTFIPVHEVLEKAGGFHDSASTLFASWAKAQADSNQRTSAFLELAAQQERSVADSLARALGGEADLESAQTYYQSPPETIPNGEDLVALRAELPQLERFAAALHALHQRWVDVYAALEATNPGSRVDELLQSCRHMVERLEKHLSSAQVQLRDA